MATPEKGSNVSPGMSDYALRAAAAVEGLVPGPHRDKKIARLFGVSVRFAKHLRRGQHWTLDRLSQASRLLGPDFDIALFHVEARHLLARLDTAEQNLRGAEHGKAQSGAGVNPVGKGGDVPRG